jgi:carboxymethylenebutenolidase
MDDARQIEALSPISAWSRRGFVTTSVATGFALAAGPVSAEVIHTDTAGLDAGEVKVPTADGSIPAYRAMPAAGGPFPTVLVVHEIFGLHEHIQDVCRRLAKAGFYAIAPDLYARQGNPVAMTDIKQVIATIVSKVPDAEVMSDLDATAAFAKASGKGDTARLAVTGFCWGGRIVWLYAAHNPDLKAAVSWYGPDRIATPLTPKNPVDVIAELKCPVLALHGGADMAIPQATIEKRQATCEADHKVCAFKIYPGVPHGFNADYRPSYRADAAKDGWARMLAWFKQYGA